MAESASNRCPHCGKEVAVGALSYSSALGAFVCAECRAAAPPPPSTSRHWKLGIGLTVGLCVLAILLVWATKGGKSVDEQQRAWDEAHRSQIIAIKSEAESLAIQGKLAEAHAKYREIEQVIGGRQVKEPTLFDLVEVARQDQDRIYKILLSRMDKSAPGGAGGASSPTTAVAAATPSSVNLPEEQEPYPVPPRAAGIVPAAPAPLPQLHPQPPMQWQQAAPSPSLAPTPSPSPTTTPEAGEIAQGQATRPSFARPLNDLPPASAPAAATPTNAPATAAAAADANPTTQAAWSLGVPKGPVSDEEIGNAIQHGVDYLMAQFNGDEIYDPDVPEAYREGINALCIYALATSSKAIVDQRIGPKSAEMVRMLEKLKTYPFDNNGAFQMPITYSHSLRACALATFNRPQDRDVLKADVDWLVNAAQDGSYTYDDQFSPAKLKKMAPPRRPQGFMRPGVGPPPGIFPNPTPIGPALATRPSADANVQQGGGDAIVQLPPLFQRGAGELRADIVLVDGGFSAPPPPPPPPPPTLGLTDNRLPIYHNNLPSVPQPDKYRSRFPFDNSNSQYGLLGVWAGAEVGIEVPDSYWSLVERHWTNCQLPSGEWYYNDLAPAARFSMTCAGIASLLVTHDYLSAGRGAGTRASAYSPALEAGLAWLEDKDNSVNIMRGKVFYVGYNLFGIERVGLASGFKNFGPYDWFLQLAYYVLKQQNPNGSFGPSTDRDRTMIDTAYILLFLSRGRHPIMFNKLHYEGPWANRPREVANLVNFTAREMERPLNWQVVDLSGQPWDWCDSPVLYLSGNKAVKFTPEEMGKFQSFVDNGGILFTHAEGNSDEFNRSIAEFARLLFPAYQLADLPLEHDLYKISFPIGTPRPRLQGVSNGVRLLMIHSPSDLSQAWQQRSFVSRKDAFHIGANIYAYATGKERFRNRLDTPLVPAPTDTPTTTIEMARLHYNGNWDPEPGAWPRLARQFEWETGMRLNVTAVDPDEVIIDRFRIAHLTGTEAIQFADRDLAAIKTFVESGGTLLIDAAGGAAPFAAGETTWLPKLLGRSELQPVQPNDPLFKHSIDATVDVPEKTLRLYAMEKLAGGGSRIKSAKVGRGRIYFSALDITSGLLGTNTWGILGYLPEYSEALVKNLVLLSASDAARK